MAKPAPSIATQLRRQWRSVAAVLGGLLLLLLLFRSREYFFPGPKLLSVPIVRKEKVGIIIPGGGVTADGKPTAWVELRLERAIELYNDLLESAGKEANVHIITLSGGTPHKPNPRDADGFPVTEARAGAKWLLDKGIPANNILEEGYSLDTLGNTYFLRTMHIEPGRFDKMFVLTNTWHMQRTKAMFEYIFDLPAKKGGKPAIGRKWDLQYFDVESGLDKATEAARQAREAESNAAFLDKTSKRFTSMDELHSFVFYQHGAYAASRLTKPRQAIDPKVLATY